MQDWNKSYYIYVYENLAAYEMLGTSAIEYSFDKQQWN